MSFYAHETIRWCANPAYHDSFRPLPPFLLENLVIWSANSANHLIPRELGFQMGRCLTRMTCGPCKPEQGILCCTSDPASYNLWHRQGRFQVKFVQKWGIPHFMLLTIWGQWGLQPTICFFRGRGESLFSGKPMLNLFLTCSELIFKIFVGSLSTGSYRVAKGQHHHLLESLAGFTSSSRNHLQMPQNDSDWQPAAAPGVCWSFSLSLPPAERMRTRSGWEIRGHPHILGAGGRITTHDRRILMILLTSVDKVGLFRVFLGCS